MTPGKPLSILHRLNESALAGAVERDDSNAVKVVRLIACSGDHSGCSSCDIELPMQVDGPCTNCWAITAGAAK